MNKKYSLAYQQILMLAEEKDSLASLMNILSFIRFEIEDINWVGLYLLKKQELVLSYFSGKVACTHIELDRGVCGKSFSLQKILNVDDVHSFPGHIACDSQSASELVIPLSHQKGVLDIDSPILERFQKEEVEFFSAIKIIIEEKLSHM